MLSILFFLTVFTNFRKEVDHRNFNSARSDGFVTEFARPWGTSLGYVMTSLCVMCNARCCEGTVVSGL